MSLKGDQAVPTPLNRGKGEVTGAIIRGMRFKVADVLGYLAAGMSGEEILNDFPFLEQEDIKASLLYAAERIDHLIIKVTLNAA